MYIDKNFTLKKKICFLFSNVIYTGYHIAELQSSVSQDPQETFFFIIILFFLKTFFFFCIPFFRIL